MKGDFNKLEEEDDFVDDGHFPVAFYHKIEDLEIDLVFVHETDEGETIHEIMEENLPPYEEIPFESYEGHVFRAVVSGTDAIISEFVISHEQHRYTIAKGGRFNDEL